MLELDRYECFVLLCVLEEYRRDSIDQWFILPDGDAISMADLQRKLEKIAGGDQW